MTAGSIQPCSDIQGPFCIVLNGTHVGQLSMLAVILAVMCVMDITSQDRLCKVLVWLMQEQANALAALHIAERSLSPGRNCLSLCADLESLRIAPACICDETSFNMQPTAVISVATVVVVTAMCCCTCFFLVTYCSTLQYLIIT